MSVEDTARRDEAIPPPIERATKSPRFVEQAQDYFGKGLPNALSVDVEDYFQVSAFENTVSRHDWDNMPARLPRNVERILQLFDNEGV